MGIQINTVPQELLSEAVEIFTEAFYDDPLFLYAFEDTLSRKRLTKLMYEFVVFDMVPKLNLTLKGLLFDGELAGCIVYTTPESREWNDAMNEPLERMRENANDPRINLIGEFAMLGGSQPGTEYFYGNELAVRNIYKRKGFGTALLNDLILQSERHPKSKGILIDTANELNIKLYETLGWELKNTVPFYEINKYFLWRENNKQNEK